MEKIKILGVDASLRNTGLAIVHYNTDLSPDDPLSFKVSNVQVLVNPAKYKGTDAILNMLDMLSDEAKKECYQEIDTAIIESPPKMFNKKFPSSVVSSLAHISGGSVVIFGIEKAHLFMPGQWNKTRKKEATHNATKALLGDVSSWHWEEKVKSDKYLEHALDAVSMALWWINSNYI